MEEGKRTGETKAAILQAGFKSHSVGFLDQGADIISAKVSCRAHLSHKSTQPGVCQVKRFENTWLDVVVHA